MCARHVARRACTHALGMADGGCAASPSRPAPPLTLSPCAPSRPCTHPLLDAVVGIAGSSVEDNKFCASVHFRNCSPDDYPSVLQARFLPPLPPPLPPFSSLPPCLRAAGCRGRRRWGRRRRRRAPGLTPRDAADRAPNGASVRPHTHTPPPHPTRAGGGGGGRAPPAAAHHARAQGARGQAKGARFHPSLPFLPVLRSLLPPRWRVLSTPLASALRSIAPRGCPQRAAPPPVFLTHTRTHA